MAIRIRWRYKNRVAARFLAPDPVGFSSGGPGYFNRYAYTMNDPVNLVDPDGAEIRAATRNGGTEEDLIVALDYLSSSQTASEAIATLEASSDVLTITVDPEGSNNFSAMSNEITYNPNLGLRVGQDGELGVSSPASGLAHELGHASDLQEHGLEEFTRMAVTLDLEPAPGGGLMGAPEIENRALAFQNQVNRELGEPSRRHYINHAGHVRVPSPTSSCRGPRCTP